MNTTKDILIDEINPNTVIGTKGEWDYFWKELLQPIGNVVLSMVGILRNK